MWYFLILCSIILSFDNCWARTIYKIHTTGKCETPYSPILEASVCETQSEAVGWTDTSVRATPITFSSYLPQGCVLKTQTNDLRLYTVANNNECSSAYKCICKITAPDCTIGINNEICLCTSSICTPSSGLVCTSTGVCEHAPSCTIGNNNDVCQCGLKDCTPSTGLSCTGSLCEHAEICPNRIGTVANINTCQCGNIDCSPMSGEYCHSESSTCRTPCPGGTYVNHLLGCSPCNEKGFFCPAGATTSSSSFKCPAGRFGPVIGISSGDECHYCSAGRYSTVAGIISNDQCDGRCPAGRYSTEVGVSSSEDCKGRCSAGKFSSHVGLASDADCAGRCSAGKFSSYTGITSNDQCFECSSGRYSDKTGITSNVECTGRCPAGKYSEQVGLVAATECKVCNVNKYQNEIGMSSCKGCPNNKIIIDTSRASSHDDVSDCVEAISVCLASEFIENNRCKPCDISFFCDGTSKIICPPGNYCPGTGRVVTCPVGRYGSHTGEKSLESACLKCSEGTYQNVIGQTYCSKGCPRGKYGQVTGASSELEGCLYCPVGHMCGSMAMNRAHSCPIGSYQDRNGSEICIFCPFDSYSDTPASKQCIQCGKDIDGNALHTSGMGSNSRAQCEILEKTCQLNQRPLASGKCEDCPIGFRGNDEGTRCIHCQLGYYQPFAASKSCFVCNTTRCQQMLGSGDLSDIEPFPVHQWRNKTIFNSVIDPFPVGIVIIYSSLIGIVILIIGSHRFCPYCFKNLDFVFSGDHVIEDTHARRILNTRLGASFTLTIPLFVTMISVFVFTTDNTLTQNGLVPIATTEIPTKPGLYQNIYIKYQTESASVIPHCSNIMVHTSDINCTKTYVKTGNYICTIALNCSVNPPFGGNNDILFVLPDSFQRAQCSVVPSVWNGTQYNITSAVISNDILAGTMKNPSTIDFDVVRSKMHHHIHENISYGLQMTTRDISFVTNNEGTAFGTHVVAIRFFSTETLFIREIMSKLDVITQIGTVLTLTISLLSVLRLVKLGAEKTIDKLYTTLYSAPPSDILQRIHILEEVLVPDDIEEVPDDIEEAPDIEEVSITQITMTDDVTGRQYIYNTITRQSAWVEESL